MKSTSLNPKQGERKEMNKSMFDLEKTKQYQNHTKAHDQIYEIQHTKGKITKLETRLDNDEGPSAKIA